MKNLIKEICKQEGKKHQASVGDVREILSILTDIIATPYNNDPLAVEFGRAIHMKVLKKYKCRVGVNINLEWDKKDHAKAVRIHKTSKSTLKKKTR